MLAVEKSPIEADQKTNNSEAAPVWITVAAGKYLL